MKVKLSDKQILNYKNDGVILIKEVFLPWIEKLKTGFHKVLSNPISYAVAYTHLTLPTMGSV